MMTKTCRWSQNSVSIQFTFKAIKNYHNDTLVLRKILCQWVFHCWRAFDIKYSKLQIMEVQQLVFYHTSSIANDRPTISVNVTKFRSI